MVKFLLHKRNDQKKKNFGPVVYQEMWTRDCYRKPIPLDDGQIGQIYFYMFLLHMLSLTQECPTFFGQDPHSRLCTGSRNQSVKFTRGGTPTGPNYSAIFMLRTYIRIQLFTNVASGRIKQTLRPRI